jgi:hypothetical protein
MYVMYHSQTHLGAKLTGPICSKYGNPINAVGRAFHKFKVTRGVQKDHPRSYLGLDGFKPVRFLSSASYLSLLRRKSTT